VYSQNEEEKYILAACETAGGRSLLDIGAWDATDKSNSRALIERDWRAVLIEPSPKAVRGLACVYKDVANVTVISAAVGLAAELIELQISDDAVSTEVPREAARWAGSYIGRLLVPAITIADILLRFGAFDFVNIDTEGTSVDLLRVLLQTEMFPRCICVEHNDRIGEALTLAQNRGYRLLYKSAENLVLGPGL
jgi:FkbM family methyltransferase